jgi:WD40 repeat protein
MLILNSMKCGSRISYTVLGILILACFAGTAAATSLGSEWKDVPYTDAPFSGVMFSTNGTYVYAGGDQMLLRSWDGRSRWGGKAGYVAAMSGDTEFVAQAIGKTLILMDTAMVDDWSRWMDGSIRKVAISENGSVIISADDLGNYNSYTRWGNLNGHIKDEVVKNIAISPKEDIVVAATEGGLRIFSTDMEPVWSDNKSGSLDSFIRFSGDGTTIITAGGNRLSSHTSTGKVNWVTYPTTNDITDLACNYDCSVIILGSQDGTVQAIDRYGKIHWTYKAGQWVNAVGVSTDALVIAAGGLDGTVYVLDRAGRMTAKKLMDTGIRPGSLAVSSDGTRIAVADQRYLYGLSVIGDANPEPVETYQRTPVRTTETPVTVLLTPTATSVPTEQVADTPVPPTPAKKSPAGILPALGALAGAGIVLVIRRV